MRNWHLASALLLTLAVASCIGTAPEHATGQEGSCDAQRHTELIGKPAAAAEVISEPKRVFDEGSPATLDYRINRTNIVLDPRGNILRITCG